MLGLNLLPSLYTRSNPPICSSSPNNLHLWQYLHLLEIHYSKYIIQQPHFKLGVLWCVRTHGWATIDLYQPGLQCCIDHHIVPVQFETLLIVDHKLAGRHQGFYHQLLNAVETSIYFLHSVLGIQVQSELVDEIFTTPLLVVVLAILLHGHVSQVPLQR